MVGLEGGRIRVTVFIFCSFYVLRSFGILFISVMGMSWV